MSFDDDFGGDDDNNDIDDNDVDDRAAWRLYGRAELVRGGRHLQRQARLHLLDPAGGDCRRRYPLLRRLRPVLQLQQRHRVRGRHPRPARQVRAVDRRLRLRGPARGLLPGELHASLERRDNIWELTVAALDNKPVPLYSDLAVHTMGSGLADDIVQETWMTSIRRIRSFQPEAGSFAGWIAGIAANLVRNHLRKRPLTAPLTTGVSRTVEVRQHRAVVATATSGVDGHASIDVPAGTYTVAASAPPAYLMCDEPDVSVASGQTAPVTQNCTLNAP